MTQANACARTAPTNQLIAERTEQGKHSGRTDVPAHALVEDRHLVVVDARLWRDGPIRSYRCSVTVAVLCGACRTGSKSQHPEPEEEERAHDAPAKDTPIRLLVISRSEQRSSASQQVGRRIGGTEDELSAPDDRALVLALVLAIESPTPRASDNDARPFPFPLKLALISSNAGTPSSTRSRGTVSNLPSYKLACRRYLGTGKLGALLMLSRVLEPMEGREECDLRGETGRRFGPETECAGCWGDWRCAVAAGK